MENSLSDDTKLWRYMDLAKFASLLHTKALWLARSDTFRDQGEGQFPPEMKEAIERAYEEFESAAESPIQNADDFRDFLCKNAYVSCWHKNANENMVMWEIYGRDSNSLAVQTTVGKIKSNISNAKMFARDFYLKEVNYNKAEDIKGRLDYIDPFFIKRPHFKFEQEARIVLSTYSTLSPSKDTKVGEMVDLDVVKAIETVLVHPDSQDWFIEVVKSISAKYGLKAPVVRGFYGNKL